MKKIGILTFHDTLNYGASLQCYALQHKLELMGANVDVIDYKCPQFEKEYSPFFVSHNNLRKLLYMLAALKMNLIKQSKKRSFQKKFFKLSKVYSSENIKGANDVYSSFITGSDQVWNWHYAGFDKTYYLNFVQDGKEKFSYGASFGFDKLDEDKVEIYKELLSGYTAISVREKSGADLISQLIHESAEVVLDPVLLLSGNEWMQVVKKPSQSNYVLLYSINDTRAFEIAKRISQKTGKKLVYLSAPIKCFAVCQKVRELGPDDFLGWFYNAEYIVTDSFHGTVCSLLFHKKFLVASENRTGHANLRVSDLLKKLVLDHRIVNTPEQWNRILDSIDYEDVEKRISDFRKDSIRFLERIVDDKNEAS